MTARTPPPTLEVVGHQTGSWDDFRSAWTSLSRQTENRSVFLSPDWVGGWIDAFGSRIRTQGLVWRDRKGAPVGCAVLTRHTVKRGPLKVGRVYLNAAGPNDPGCEHNDLLVLPEYRDFVLSDVVRFVIETDADAFTVVGARQTLAGELFERWPGESVEGYISESAYVSLEPFRSNGHGFMSSLSRNTRSQIRRSVRLYEERFGTPHLEIAGRADVGDWFEEMLALHEARWRERGEGGAFATAERRAFHDRLIAEGVDAADPDRVRVDLLRVRFGDQTIGILYNLGYRGRVSFYQSGLRYEDDNRLKPGLVIHALAIQHYVAQGEQEYDLLGGDPGSVRYKRSLGTHTRTLAWIRLPLPTFKARLLRALSPAGRGDAIRAWLPPGPPPVASRRGRSPQAPS